MSVKQIAYKGKTILYADYRGMNKEEQLFENLEELGKLTKASATSVLIMTNFEGVSVGNEFMNRVKAWGVEYKAKLQRQAVVGVTGLGNILLHGYITFTGEKNLKPFSSETEAMDWLVS